MRKLGKGLIIKYPNRSLGNQKEMEGSVWIAVMNCCCYNVFHLVSLDHVKQLLRVQENLTS